MNAGTDRGRGDGGHAARADAPASIRAGPSRSVLRARAADGEEEVFVRREDAEVAEELTTAPNPML